MEINDNVMLGLFGSLHVPPLQVNIMSQWSLLLLTHMPALQ